MRLSLRSLALLLALLLPVLAACDSSDPEDEVIINDLVVGTGVEAKNGNRLEVHYVGTLEDGFEFDSSYNRGDTFEFVLGRGDVIRGWDKGLVGMREGGTRRLTIPPSLGYGNRPIYDPDTGAVIIPANSTLIFEIKLVDVR